MITIILHTLHGPGETGGGDTVNVELFFIPAVSTLFDMFYYFL